MTFLRYLALVVLGLWTGGLAALGGIGAPTLFRTLEAQDSAGGRELAGLAFGAIFQHAQEAAWGLGLVLLLSLGARAALGPRPRRLAIRIWITTAMLAASAASVFVIAPRIDRIRGSISGPIASLAPTDARRVEFGRLHGLTNGLMVLTIAAGLGLMWAELTDPK
jgi:hypothetical protein